MSGKQYDADDVAFDPFIAEAGHSAWADGAHDEEGGEPRLQPDQTSFFERHRALHLTWSNLGYSVQTKGRRRGKGTTPSRKTILSQISGEVRPGQILAIMGSSGAGKTTLLNLLAGRMTTSRNFETTGYVRMNGLSRTAAVYKRVAAYVEQEDKMFGELTVEEQLIFSAFLRLPRTMEAEKKMQRVEDTIRELGLSKCRHSPIGNEMLRGVSGGERKRVNVGTELVTDPSLLFLDEPTSGLDSFNALNVMYTLRKLASSGRTVVTTIHQPRSNIFQLFDMLCLLSEGRMMYFGPAQDAVAYFSGLHFPCPPQFNPADFFIDLLSVDPRNSDLEEKSKTRVALLGDKELKTLEECPVVSSFSEEELKDNAKHAAELVDEVKFQTSWPNELRWLARRNLRLLSREKAANGTRFGQTIVFSVILGLIWLNSGRDNLGVQTIGGVLFFLLVNQGFGGVFGVLFVYPLERAVVLRERASGTYRVTSYLVARMAADIPRDCMFALLFSCITYWMVGLGASAGQFFFFVLVVILCVFIAEGLTYCISTITPDPQTSAAIVPVFMILSMLFGGFFIGTNNIPAAVAWIRWISFVNYGFTALMRNQFDGTDMEVAAVSLFNLQLSKWAAVGALVGMNVFFRLLLYIILRRSGPKFNLGESRASNEAAQMPSKQE